MSNPLAQNEFPEWTPILKSTRNEIIQNAISNNSLYIHDLECKSYYKINWSLKKLIINGIKGDITTPPANKFSTILQQIENSILCVKNECCGIQKITSFDTLLAPYLKESELTDTQIKQLLKDFIFNINLIAQSEEKIKRIHIGFDWTCPTYLKNKKAFIGNVEQNYTYGECQKEIDFINREFLSIMEQGDVLGRPFSYTIPEYNISSNFNWNGKNVSALFKLTQKYGLPLFVKQNDQAEKKVIINSIAINLPQIGYLSKNQDNFFERLNNILGLIKEVALKKVENNRIEAFIDEDTVFGYSIVLSGLNECCINFINQGIANPTGKEFAEKVLSHIKTVLDNFSKECNVSFFIEDSYVMPLEYSFAKKDKELFEGIKTSGAGALHYTTSFSLPSDTEFDIFTAVKHQAHFSEILNNNITSDFQVGNQIKDWQNCKSLVKKISENYNLFAYTISPSYSICPEHGYFLGNHRFCPVCNKTTEIYARISGSYMSLDKLTEEQKEEILKENSLSVKSEPSLFQDFTYELFSSKNCKKCPPVKHYISTKNLTGTEINVDTNKGLDIAAEKGVFMTPTVIFYNKENQEIVRTHNIDEIESFLSYQGISTGESSSSALLS